MPDRNLLRPLTEEERQRLEQISRSPTEPARRVEIARTILMIVDGRKISEIAQALRVSEQAVLNRQSRYNEVGLEALNRKPGGGRPATFDTVQRGQMVLAAKTHPQQLGLPFEHWTMARLTQYVNSIGIPVSHSRLKEVLKQADLRWSRTQTDFTERSDPPVVS